MIQTTMRPRGGHRAPLVALAVLAGCQSDSARIVEPICGRVPVILASSTTANSRNVLSAAVTARVQDADSVAVRFGTIGTSLDSVTAAVRTTGVPDSVVVPVLGLLPLTQYALQLIAYNRCGVARDSAVIFATGALPDDLPHYSASGSDPSTGYVVFAAGGYGLVIDNTGRVVWYHRFPIGPGLNFQAQPTGRYVARPPSPPTQPSHWIEVDPLGTITRTLGCARGLQPRFHDMIAQVDGSYWVMCDETRTMDLSAFGGLADAQVMGTVIQKLRSDDTLLFEWSPFDHFEITDLDPADRGGATVNWTHGNAIDLDRDGNLLVSFRSLSEITKIDTRTGEVAWRMGGRANQFAFEGTPAPAFARQHGLRVTGPGELLLLDNLGAVDESRAERYAFDTASRAARLIATYGSQPAVVARLGGTTQQLPGGRTLVTFGNGGRVEEYDASGGVVWRIEGNPGYVFRAQRIRSLYHPGTGL